MQLTLLITISVLAGLFAMGFVWLSWDVAYKLILVYGQRQHRKKLEEDADQLMEMAVEPKDDERPA